MKLPTGTSVSSWAITLLFFCFIGFLFYLVSSNGVANDMPGQDTDAKENLFYQNIVR